MAVDFILGMDAVLKIGAADAALSALVEVSNVKDLKLGMSKATVDITTRANLGWRAKAATLKECTCEFQMLWKPEDTGFEAIRTAFLDNSEIGACPLSEDDGEGPRGNWVVTKFDRNESLEEGITVDVTLELAKYIAWETGTGS